MIGPSFDRRGVLTGGLAVPMMLSLSGPAAAQQAPSLVSRLAPFARFLGEWRGEGEGEPGRSAVERSYMTVLGGQFIRVRNISAYAPQERNPNGERHEDHGFISFDRARNRAVLRQFHIEGFVAQYVAATEALDGPELAFVSEYVENIPAGFRARETYRFDGPDEFEEIFETAEPGGEFAVYSRNMLRRA